MEMIPELPTPALTIDLACFEHNLAAAEDMVRSTGKLLRPHVKTHGCTELARRQLGPAAKGVTCATVGEAEAMVGAGIADVLIANEVVAPDKIKRLVSLAARSQVTVAVDAHEPALALSAEAERAGVTVGVLVDIDIGLGRCGVREISEARRLALAVAAAPGLRFEGMMGYEGRVRASVPQRADWLAQAYRKLAEAKAAIESTGLSVATVSSAGTSTLPEALRDASITEIQAGCYVLMEPDLEGLNLPFRCAAAMVGTVVSQSPGRVVLDAGGKAISCERGLPLALGPRAETLAVADEHTTLGWMGKLPGVGSQVGLRPGHIPRTFNLHDQVWLVRDGQVVERLQIDARARFQ